MDATSKIRAAVRGAAAGLVEREALIELIVLAAVAGEHALGAWRLKIEGIARTIDASFTKDGMPTDLAAIREKIVATLAEA